MTRVTDNGAVSEAFAVTNGVKQGCVLAPTPFSLMFSVMLMDAYRDELPRICIACWTDVHLLIQRRMHFQSRVSTTTVHELLFADDCILSTTSVEEEEEEEEEEEGVRSDRQAEGYRIFIGGVDPRVGKVELEREFDRFGPIVDVWVARNPPGFAFIVYKYLEDAEKAIRRMDRSSPFGSRLRVEHAANSLKFKLEPFDGTIYEQVKGTPMGSPIPGFIAEAVLQRLESPVFQHHRPKFWDRYMDDTFVVIERDQVLIFKEHLNVVFPDIQFTIEEEGNNQLAFLDVLVCSKDCGGLKTKMFRKGEVNYDWAMDFFRDFEVPWTDAERYVLFQIIAHHNEEGFTFGNMADLVECIKIGGVDLLPGLGFELIDQTKLKVVVYAVNASIPFNALNVSVEMDRNKTVGDLMHIVRFANELPTKELKLYVDKFCEVEAAEDKPLRTLIEPGSDANLLDLYLDFSVGFIDDPIVLCDDYFKNRTVEITIEDLK
nr:unnamed protein product [Spirometra erinaceieuropaei]